MRRLAALALLVMVSVLATARTAAAVSPSAVGWWWLAETGAATVPPPPTVPPGGFMVGGDPSGANAIAALRFELEEGQGSPAMTLRVADNGDVNGASAQLAACRVLGAWAPVFSGPWPSRPTADCATAVVGTRSDDGKSFVFNLEPFQVGNKIDIVLTPGVGSSFNLSFNPPDETTLKTAAKPSFPADSSVAPDFASSLSDESASVVDFGAPLDVPAFTPAPTEDVSLVGAPSRRQLGSPALAVPEEARKVSGVAIVLLLGAIAVGYALSQVPAPAVSGLGPMAAAVAAPVAALRRRRAAETHAQIGGLGRFARTRTGPPPKL